MGARGLVVLVTLVGLVPITLMAQVAGKRQGPGLLATRRFPVRHRRPCCPAIGLGSGRSACRHRRHDRRRLRAIPLPGPFAGSVPVIPIIAQPSTSRDVFRAGRRTYAPRYGRLVGTYRVAMPAGTARTTTRADPTVAFRRFRRPRTTSGETGPLRHACVSAGLVDGFYVGTVADFQDRGLWLESGPRRIELRADGYETETFDVRINEDQPVEYQRDLARAAARSEAPRVAAVPKTFYVIPGCYAGDTPPRTDRLPGGCSSRNVRTIPPVLNRLTPR